MERYYDFNVWSHRKFIEKLRYIQRNPVERGLVAGPEQWAWSSFRHYLTGDRCPVEIESHWTARIRERAGIFPTVRVRTDRNLCSKRRAHLPRPFFLPDFLWLFAGFLWVLSGRLRRYSENLLDFHSLCTSHYAK